MSTGSDTDEFYDAEDIAPSPSKLARKTKGSASQFDNVFVLNAAPMDQPEFTGNVEELTEACSKCDSKDNDEIFTEPSFLNLKPAGRRRFRELRQSMQNDEDEVGPTSTSTPESQGSSVEGIFPSVRTTHPFRIIEHDAISLQSMTSLGRVGRILGGTIDPSSISVSRDSNIIPTTSGITTSHKVPETPKSNDVMPLASPPTTIEEITDDYRPALQEPDVIASTKTHLNKNIDKPKIPIAPPRRKKKISTTSRAESEIEKSQKYEESETITRLEGKIDTTNYNNMISHGQGTVLHGPVNTIETMTQQFEHSLDVANCNNNTVTPTNSFIALNSNVSANGNNASPPVTEKARSTNSSRSSTATRSLDLRMATKGQYVVKPQDEDISKAEGPSSEELERLELLKFELLHSRSGGLSSSGHSSLGPTFKAYYSPRNSKERRKSAGDEELLKQLNMFVRTRTDSGKQLTDMEILEQVTVLNLDTGERVPLSIAEDKLPQCINPLSLHIMRLTSEYISTGNLNKQAESDEESVGAPSTDLGAGEGETEGEEGSRLRRRTTRLKRFLGSTVKKTMDKAKSIAAEVSHARHREDVADIDDVNSPGELNIKLKASSSHKGPYEFDSLQHVQDLSEQHVGPVWCMKFSACGRLLATAGQDRVLRVWVLRDAYVYFQDMRTKYNADQKVSPTPSQESLVSQQSSEELGSLDGAGPFMSRPFCTYTGHTSDLLDVSWSKNHFVLSSSMDKTVRLWHISRKECLCCFQHIDFVTAIVFHPRDDRYFLSGSLDGKLRLWNIPDKKVAVWNEVDGQAKLITAANFCQNGKFAVVGTYDGRCIFYTTDQLKYHTQIHVRSTRGKNATGRKISGIEPMPGEDKILITSNDSRIRLYDLRDLNLSCKYKGYMNVSSQIKASFSHDGKYIVSGSENQCIYIWKTHHDYSKFSSVRRDRNDFWEGIKAHNAVVTCAVFAPSPDNIIKIVEERDESNNEPSGSQSYLTNPEATDPMVEQRTKGCGGHVLVSADFTGCIKVFINKTKPKHSSLPASALA